MDNNYNLNNYKNEQQIAEAKSAITIAFILGILGIVLTFMSGIVGLVLAIISLVFVNKANKLIEADINVANGVASEMGKLSAAKILSIISLVVFGVMMLCTCGGLIVYFVAIFGAIGMGM